MIYYLRHSIFGQVNVYAADNVDCSQKPGFIRWLPEVSKPADLTPELMAKLKAEADAWVLEHPEESHAYLVIDATSVTKPVAARDMWVTIAVVSRLDPFNITGPHRKLRIKCGAEHTDYDDAILAIAPGGEADRFIVTYRCKG